MGNKIKISIFGNLAMEENIYIDKFPSINEECLVLKRIVKPGGCGLHSAFIGSLVGAKIDLITETANDNSTQNILQLLESKGIKIYHIYNIKYIPNFICILDKDFNRIVYLDFPKDNESINNPKKLKFGLNELRNILNESNAVFVNPFEPIDILEILKLSKELGLKTVLSPQSFLVSQQTNIKEILKYTDIFILNEKEICLYTDANTLEAAVKLINKIYNKILVVTKGENGCYVKCGKMEYNFKTNYVKAKNAMGIGDTFAIAFTHHFIKYNSIKKAVKYANKIAGCFCSFENALFDRTAHQEIIKIANTNS